jgi:Tol biopolymer transport system component/DNA-binding winged helix-turn-helix (wHTH) protein
LRRPPARNAWTGDGKCSITVLSIGSFRTLSVDLVTNGFVEWPQNNKRENLPVNANVRVLRRAEQSRYARIGDWLVDMPCNRLVRGDRELRPSPKAMAVFRQLLLANGAPVSRDELLGTVWKDTFTTDDVLTHAITELRRSLEDDPKAPRYIETIPKVGYRLLERVQLLDDLPGPQPEAEGVAAIDLPMLPPARPWALLAALCGLALVCGVAPLLFGHYESAQPIFLRQTIAPSRPLFAPSVRPVTAEPNSEVYPHLSPDGLTVAYAARYPDDSATRIYLRGLSGSAPLRLTHGESDEDTYPVWSPDGSQLAFMRVQGSSCSLNIVSALGGRERPVADCPQNTLDYFDWTPDGRALVAMRFDPDEGGVGRPFETIHFFDLDTGREHALDYERSRTDNDVQPRYSPDGTRIAFRRGAVPYSDIFWVAAEGGKVHQLTRVRAQIRGFDWLPDGHRMLFSSDHEGIQQLYLLDFDSGAITAMGIRGVTYPAVARNKPVAVFQQENRVVNLIGYKIGAGIEQTSETLFATTRNDSWPQFAPNDDRVAFVSDRSGDSQLWLYDPESRQPGQLTHHNEGLGLAKPSWSPNGKRVLYVGRGSGFSSLYSVAVDSGQVRQETGADENVRFGTYSADGRWILYCSDRSGLWQLWRRPNGPGLPERLTEQPGAVTVQDILGDESVYFNRSNDVGLFKLDLETRKETHLDVPLQFWNSHAWRVTGKGIYYLAMAQADKVNLYFQPWGAKSATALFQTKYTADTAVFTLSHEGQRAILAATVRDDTDVMTVDLSNFDL